MPPRGLRTTVARLAADLISDLFDGTARLLHGNHLEKSSVARQWKLNKES